MLSNMSLTKSQINKINDFAIKYYKALDQTHGVEHLNRTVKLAAYLAKKEKADIQIVKLGAMFHQFHDAGEVKKFLRTIDVDKKLAGAIAHCVDCSSRKSIHKAKTIEAKVVFDADKLQVIGPFGIAREISWCTVVPKMSFRRALIHTRTVEQKCFAALQTRTARKLAEEHHAYLIEFWKLLDEMDKGGC